MRHIIYHRMLTDELYPPLQLGKILKILLNTTQPAKENIMARK